MNGHVLGFILFDFDLPTSRNISKMQSGWPEGHQFLPYYFLFLIITFHKEFGGDENGYLEYTTYAELTSVKGTIIYYVSKRTGWVGLANVKFC